MHLLALLGCSLGLTSLKDSGASTVAADTAGEALPPTEVDVGGLLYGIGAADFVVTEPAGAEAFVEELLDADLLIYVAEERADALVLTASLAEADGHQDPCEPVIALPTATWADPRFQSGPADLALTLGGEPATFGDFTLSGAFDAYAFGWDGALSATLDAREVNAALPPELEVCGLLEGLGGGCAPCADGATACFDVRLDQVHAELVSWPYDPAPDRSQCP